MARKSQIAGHNSVGREVKSLQGASQVPEVPHGFATDDPEFAAVWEAFTRARGVDGWRQFDLILLARAAVLEIDIRKLKRKLDEEGFIVINQRGTACENAAVRAFDTFVRMQLTIIRSLSLNQTEVDPRTLNKQGKHDEKAVSILKENGAESLLAMPN